MPSFARSHQNSKLDDLILLALEQPKNSDDGYTQVHNIFYPDKKRTLAEISDGMNSLFKKRRI